MSAGSRMMVSFQKAGGRTMKRTDVVFAILVVAVIGAGAAYAKLNNPREAVEFYAGHSHDADGKAVNAPEHSGGLDRNGCHNRSVPYHCH